jgi:hypothetical protein
VRTTRLAAFVFAMGCAAMAGAQQSIDLGSVSGRVIDSTGGVLPGVQVSARHLDTNVTLTTVTGDEGRFRLAALRVGRYEMVAHLQGFRDASRVVTLTAGAAIDLTFDLGVAGGDTRVTVSASADILETARSQIAGTVSEAEIRDVPLNGRNFLDLALLVPGATPTNVNSTQLFPETSAVSGVTLSVNSQRNLSNNFVVDGLSANDDAASLSGMTFSVDALEEFQVVTSGGQAELGRALGGFVNVVTKSGTNDRQGTVYVFGRDDALNAANAVSGTTLPMRQLQVGGSLGGPVAMNRTFYFVNVEHRRLRQSGLVTILPGAIDAINARLAATSYQEPSISTGEYSNPLDATNGLAKLNHAFNPRHELTVRYTVYGVTSENARGAGGLNAQTASSGLDSVDQSVAATETAVASDRTLLELRGQAAWSSLHALPSDPIGPAVSIAGVATFGTLSVSPTARQNTLVETAGSVSRQAGAHAVRAGVSVLYNDDTINFPRASRGSYAFSSLETFLAGSYNNAGFTQTFGAQQVQQHNPNAGAFLQDEWHARSGLTINLGVRYDLQFLDTVATDANNISPRLGLAWSPFGSERTIVRGSAGLFFDRVPLRAVSNALLSAGNTLDVNQLRQVTVSLSPAQAGAPVFPGILSAPVPSVTLPALTTIDRHLQAAYSRQAGVEIERQLAAGLTLSVGYQYVRGVGLLMAINQNVPSCVASGTNNGCRPNPSYANNNQYSAAGSSNYHGLHVSLLQRPAHWAQYRLSYTLSKSMNDVGEFFFSTPIDPFDISKDWGRSDDDQRHRLVFTGSVVAATDGATTWKRIVNGFQMSGAVQAYSALPFNVTSGVTTIQGTAGRPIVNGEFIPRNARESTRYGSMNLRVSRAFMLGRGTRVEVMLEGFNVTNHVNVVTRNTNFGAGTYPTDPSPTFGQVTGVSDPRSFQLAARIRF